MSTKPSSINKDLEATIKAFLRTAKDSGDPKDMALAINAAIKWEAVKLKVADMDYGSHFDDIERADDDTGISGQDD